MAYEDLIAQALGSAGQGMDNKGGGTGAYYSDPNTPSWGNLDPSRIANAASYKLDFPNGGGPGTPGMWGPGVPTFGMTGNPAGGIAASALNPYGAGGGGPVGGTGTSDLFRNPYQSGMGPPSPSDMARGALAPYALGGGPQNPYGGIAASPGGGYGNPMAAGMGGMWGSGGGGTLTGFGNTGDPMAGGLGGGAIPPTNPQQSNLLESLLPAILGSGRFQNNNPMNFSPPNQAQDRFPPMGIGQMPGMGGVRERGPAFGGPPPPMFNYLPSPVPQAPQAPQTTRFQDYLRNMLRGVGTPGMIRDRMMR